jgi:hypothetical protein
MMDPETAALGRALAAAVLAWHDAPADARSLAQQVLGLADGRGLDRRFVNAGDRLRLIPSDEPLFLIRGQDVVAGEAVRHWASLAAAAGASPAIVKAANAQAGRMDEWKVKKVPDLPA